MFIFADLHRTFLPRTLELCNCDSKCGSTLLQFRRSSMAVVKFNIFLIPSEFWPPEEFWSIHRLLDLPDDMHWAIIQILRNAAVAFQEEIEVHKNSAKTTKSKQYKYDSESSIEVLKHVPLFRVNSNKNLMATRFALCPL